MLTSDASRIEKGLLIRVLPICVLLAAMVLILYWPVQRYDFVSYDDEIYVTNNRHVRSGFSFEGIQWAFSNFYASLWHPLTWLSHMLDYQLYGLHAAGHHWTSVIIHCASTVLLFLVLWRMTIALWGSALVAVLFAIHPLHVESVAWVAERKDVLCGFFWILTMGAYIHYVKQPVLRRYLLVCAFFILGLLSKPMIVTLPFALLLLDYWPLRRFARGETAFDRWLASVPASMRDQRVRLVAEKMPLIILSAACSAITYVASQLSGAVKSLDTYSLGARLSNAVVSYVLYIWKMIWPVDLAVLYPHVGMPPLWQALTSAALLVTLTGFIWHARIRAPYLAVGWFWYLGTLVPALGLVQVGSHAMADRYTYIPLVGLFIALVWGAKAIAAKGPDMKIGIIGISILSATVMVFPARVQIETWRDTITLFEHTLHVTGVNPIAQCNIGAYYLDRGDCKKAVPNFLKSLEMKREFAPAYHGLGVCASREGDWDRALHYYQSAIQANPSFEKPRIDRGLVYMQQQNYDAAAEEFRQVLRMDPHNEAAYTNLGMLSYQQGALLDAEVHLRSALRLNEELAEAHNNLGIVTLQLGRRDEAIVHFRQALKLAPENPAIRKNAEQVLRSALH